MAYFVFDYVLKHFKLIRLFQKYYLILHPNCENYTILIDMI